MCSVRMSPFPIAPKARHAAGEASTALFRLRRPVIACEAIESAFTISNFKLIPLHPLSRKHCPLPGLPLPLASSVDLIPSTSASHMQYSISRAHLGPPSLNGRHTRARRQRSAQPPAAFFQALFRRVEPQQQLPGGLVEKPLYRPNEMVQMGPFNVSPMGFGTWSWVRASSAPLLC